MGEARVSPLLQKVRQDPGATEAMTELEKKWLEFGVTARGKGERRAERGGGRRRESLASILAGRGSNFVPRRFESLFLQTIGVHWLVWSVHT